MIHPWSEVRFIDTEKGNGLFATRDIPRGTITWVRDQLDREISPVEFLQYDEAIQEVILHYSYRNVRGNYIFCWDNTRYVNHDCHPNTCITPYNLEIAIRDIAAGDEITNHYGMLNIIEPFVLPGDEHVVVGPDDLLIHGAKWDRMLAAAIPHLLMVDQPLRTYLENDQWQQIARVARGEEALLSVTTCHLKKE